MMSNTKVNFGKRKNNKQNANEKPTKIHIQIAIYWSMAFVGTAAPTQTYAAQQCWQFDCKSYLKFNKTLTSKKEAVESARH